MTTSGGSTPPGWYDVGQGWLRWFDGTEWTDHVHQVESTVPSPTDLPEVEEVPDAVLFGAGMDFERAPDPDRSSIRRGVWVGIAVLVVLVIVIAAIALSGSGDDDGDPAPPAAGPAAGAGSAAPVSTNPAASPTASSTSSGSASSSSSPSVRPTGMVDGDWELVFFRATRAEFTGDFAGTGRIRYNGADADAANNFTVTVFKADKQVGVLQGPIQTIAPGQTKTVTFISTDEYVAGPYRLEFQKDL